MKYILTFLADVPEDACPLTIMQNMIEGYRAIPLPGRAVYLTVKDMDWRPTDQSKLTHLLDPTEEKK